MDECVILTKEGPIALYFSKNTLKTQTAIPMFAMQD
jgi:hypothetical protein